MAVLYALEKIRNPVLNVIMQFITYLGQENLFIIAAIGMFWCVNKRRGYYMMTVGFAGVALNQALKLTFRIPRPWTKDPSFTIVESARADATGYSFPSGHTQTASVVFGTTARWTEKRWLRYVCIAIILLVGFSRMYLGVHTPLDVSVSLALGAVMIFAFYPLFANPDKSLLPMFLIVLAVSGAFALTLDLIPVKGDVDAVYLEDTMFNAYKMFGCVAGVAISCPLEERFVKFDTAAPLPLQSVKLSAGFVLITILRAALKAPLERMLPDRASGSVRYFIIVLFACLVWPMSFKFLRKLYDKCIVSQK